jgi:predicted choloylglycine hydrolase
MINSPGKQIQFFTEGRLGQKWQKGALTAFPAYRAWYKQFNSDIAPSTKDCIKAIRHHMPEMEELFTQLTNLLELQEADSAILSFYCPAPVAFGCSQGVWLQQHPVLVRNFDYLPNLNEGRYIHSSWHGVKVMGTLDCLWGLLDGINEYGLSISVTLVGSVRYTEGFAAPIVVRYILEFCRTTEQAVQILMKVPLCTAYNFTIVDEKFTVKTLEINPLKGIYVSNTPVAANHQGETDMFKDPKIYSSILRKNTMLDLLHSPYSTVESFIHAFGYFPLMTTDHTTGVTTLYTAAYNCLLKSAEYRWQSGAIIYQSIFDFHEAEFNVQYSLVA